MTSRERVQAALAFEAPDRLPCHESPWEQTLSAWRTQGLPAAADLADCFDFDLSFMYLDTSPGFPQRILERAHGSITYEDRFGYTITKPEGMSATLHFRHHNTTDEEAWGRTKTGFTLSEGPARIDEASYFGHFDPYPSWQEARVKYDRLRTPDRYMLFMCYGPWEATWRHRGMENLLTDVMISPDWVREMAESYQDLVIAVLRRCLDQGMKPDGVFTADDLGSSTGPLMAPGLWCDLFQPSVARLGDFLRENGIDFWMHSDGAIGMLIDPMVDAGVRVLNPLEAKAGMDVVELRRRYGDRLAFFGNIDATKMYGPIEGIEAELRRKIPLACDGGYIMHSDHSCPPEVSFERYCWIHKRAHALFDERMAKRC